MMTYKNKIYGSIAILFLLIGYGFYGLARPAGVDAPDWLAASVSLAWMPTWLWGSLPSFLHLLAFSLLSFAVLNSQSRYRGPVAFGWLLACVAHEFAQDGYFLGTYDPADIAALVLATTLFLAITGQAIQSTLLPRWRGFLMLPVVLGGVFATAACEDFFEPSLSHKPIYLSYDALRGPLITETDRALGENGKIYLYQDYLFVSEPNKGIHVFDNADPANPKPIYFIVLPGNLDISVRDNHILADSFIDLVSINITDIQTPLIASRQKNVFAYDAYQALPEQDGQGDYIYLRDLDNKRGVVVGYIRVEKEGDK